MSTRAAHAKTSRLASGRPELKVLRRRGRSLIKRSASRRSAPWLIVGVITVAAIVAGVLLEQVILAQSAFKLEAINKRVVAAESLQEELLAEMAKLESPGRIERYARTRLGMTDPTSVEYIVARVPIRTDNRLANAVKASELPLPGSASASQPLGARP